MHELVEQLAAIVESSDDAIIGKTLDGIITSWNQGAERTYGYAAQEVIGQPVQILVPPNRPDEIPAILAGIKRGERFHHFETVRLRKDGAFIDVSLSVSPIKNAAGQIVGASTIARRITERSRAESALQRTGTWHRAILHTAMDGFWLLDGDGRLVEVNEAYSQMSGYSQQELLTMRVPDLEAAETAGDTAAHLQKIMARGADRFESRHRRKDGSLFDVEVSVRYRPTDGGGFVAFLRDITERKRAEEELARLNRQHELLLGSVAEGILGLDLQGNHTFVNPAAARMLGFDADELIGRHSHSSWHHTKPDGRPYPKEECQIYAAYRDGTVHASSSELFWRKDGTSFPVSYTSTPVYEEGRLAGAVVTFSDITERKQAEDALRERAKELSCLYAIADAIENEDQIEGVLQCSVDVMPNAWRHSDLACARITVDGRAYQTRQFRETAWRQAADIRVEGRPAGVVEVCYLEECPSMDEGPFLREERSLINEVAARLGRLIARKRADAALRESEQRYHGTVVHLRDALREREETMARLRDAEIRYRTLFEQSPDGIVLIDPRTALPVEFNDTAPTQLGYTRDEFARLRIADYEAAETVEETARRMSAIEKFGHDTFQTRHRTRQGDIRTVVVTVQHMESSGQPLLHCIHRDVTQLHQQTALARLGEMAAVVAHEVKNPLAAVRGVIQVIGRRLPRDGKDAAAVDSVIARIDALDELMKEMLLFARPPQPQLAVVDIVALARETATLLGEDPTARGVRVEVDGETARVMADTKLLNVVLLNLLLNAAQSMQGQGAIRVSVTADRPVCRISVADTGPGIPAEIRDQIFTPFFTTKSRGTGLGLSTAKQLVEAHHGRISVACPSDGGTIVTIELPC